MGVGESRPIYPSSERWRRSASTKTVRTSPIRPPARRWPGRHEARGPRTPARRSRRPRRAFPAWRAATPPKERAAVLRRWAELMMAARGARPADGRASRASRWRRRAARSPTARASSSGSPRRRSASTATRSPRTRRTSASSSSSSRSASSRRITPWNFPDAMITRKVGPALAAGCTVVVKPADADAALRAGAGGAGRARRRPDGRVQRRHRRRAGAIGGELTANPIVRKISFTGSTEVGKLLMAQCAGTVKKVSLELGGNAPFIVFDDADLDAAVAGRDRVASSATPARPASAPTGFYVQDGVYDAFAAKLAAAVRDAQGRRRHSRPASRQGPLINDAGGGEGRARTSRTRVARARRSSPAASATRSAARFFEPTVLAGVTPTMVIVARGDVRPGRAALPLRDRGGGDRARQRHRVRPRRVLLQRATSAASGASPRRSSPAWSASTPGLISTEVAPFGGVKESGIGREGSKYGIEDCLEIKYVCLGV